MIFVEQVGVKGSAQGSWQPDCVSEQKQKAVDFYKQKIICMCRSYNLNKLKQYSVVSVRFVVFYEVVPEVD